VRRLPDDPHAPAGFPRPFRRYLVTLHEGVLSGQAPRPPCDARTVRRWQHTVGRVIGEAIATLTRQVLRAQTVSRQEQAFLSGTLRGYAALRTVRQIAARHGHDPPASGLLGWAYQLNFPAQPVRT